MDNSFGFGRAHLIDSHLSAGSYSPAYPVFKKKKQPERRDTSVPQNGSAHMPLVPLNWKMTNKTFCQILLLCFYESNGFRDIKLNRGPNGSNELYSTSPKRSHYVTLVDRRFRRESSLLPNHRSFFLPRWSISFLKIAAVRKWQNSSFCELTSVQKWLHFHRIDWQAVMSKFRSLWK